MKPEFLYHFTNAEVAINKILPSKTLRLNNIGNMNDPKENLIHLIELDSKVPLRNPYDKPSITDLLFAEEIRNTIYILSFSIPKEPYRKETYNYETSVYKFQSMWSHYADNNKGICLRINLNEFLKENEKTLEYFKALKDKVEYTDLVPQFIPGILRGQLVTDKTELKSRPDIEVIKEKIRNEKFLRDRFFTKNPDWKGESEYRFLIVTDEGSNPVLKIEKSLTQVILGINFSKHLLPSLSAYTNDIDVKGIDLNFRGELSIKSLA
jgi:hypothetical protein